MAVVVVGVAGLLFSIVFIKYKMSQNKNDASEVKDDDDVSSEI
jgi:hypothetical protein